MPSPLAVGMPGAAATAATDTGSVTVSLPSAFAVNV